MAKPIKWHRSSRIRGGIPNKDLWGDHIGFHWGVRGVGRSKPNQGQFNKLYRPFMTGRVKIPPNGIRVPHSKQLIHGGGFNMGVRGVPQYAHVGAYKFGGVSTKPFSRPMSRGRKGLIVGGAALAIGGTAYGVHRYRKAHTLAKTPSIHRKVRRGAHGRFAGSY